MVGAEKLTLMLRTLPNGDLRSISVCTFLPGAGSFLFTGSPHGQQTADISLLRGISTCCSNLPTISTEQPTVRMNKSRMWCHFRDHLATWWGRCSVIPRLLLLLKVTNFLCYLFDYYRGSRSVNTARQLRHIWLLPSQWPSRTDSALIHTFFPPSSLNTCKFYRVYAVGAANNREFLCEPPRRLRCWVTQVYTGLTCLSHCFISLI